MGHCGVSGPYTRPKEDDVSGWIARLKEYTHSPQARRAAATVRRAAADPHKRAQASRLLGRLRGHK